MKLPLIFCGIILTFICNGQEARPIINYFGSNLSKYLIINDHLPAASFFNNPQAYSIQRSTFGLAGSSRSLTTQKGSYYVSQSIGQTSVGGTSYKNGFTLRQGYQQPLISVKLSNPSSAGSLQAVIYPNPFQQAITIQFQSTISDQVSIRLFDVTGRAVVSKNISASQFTTLDLDKLSKGVYILKVSSGTKNLMANLIKN